MATQLDFEEQEQLDQLKAFWKQYGNLITWALVLALAAYVGWNRWGAWQRDQGEKAASLYDAVDKAVQAGDAAVASRVFADMKERYPRATFTQQAGLAAARLEVEKGQPEAARANLAWVAEKAGDDDYRSIAHLRLAGMLLDDKKYDDALKQIDAVDAVAFAALAADRRGDVLMAQGKTEDAKVAYQKAWAAMDAKVDYRRLIEAKLNVMGAAPAPVASAAGASK
jgi:predicted negative regulator of RcsB-dependent stress response